MSFSALTDVDYREHHDQSARDPRAATTVAWATAEGSIVGHRPRYFSSASAFAMRLARSNALQREAGYIDARPTSARSTKTFATHGRAGCPVRSCRCELF